MGFFGEPLSNLPKTGFDKCTWDEMNESRCPTNSMDCHPATALGMNVLRAFLLLANPLKVLLWGTWEAQLSV